MTDLNAYLKKNQNHFESMSLTNLIQQLVDDFGLTLTLASSLGVEDQLLTHVLLKHQAKSRIFVLDTGRLPQETYDVMQITMAKYQFHYDVYCPDAQELEQFLKKEGPNSFYESVEKRKACCYVRKVAPLQKALMSANIWITGLRQAQSVTRQGLKVLEWDEQHRILKVNPLLHWSDEAVWKQIKTEQIPYNVLHDKGYPSIGCAPCTRPIKDGEDSRAGRWWWESAEGRECGLHIKKKESMKHD